MKICVERNDDALLAPSQSEYLIICSPEHANLPNMNRIDSGRP